METISQIFQSPAWWISTVVVALVINLLSTYLWGRYVDKWLSGRSERRRKRSEQEQSALFAEIEWLSKDPTDLIIAYIRGALGLLSVLLLMATLLTLAFIVAVGDISGYVRGTFNGLFLCLLALILAIGNKVGKIGEMCRAANTLRVKALQEERGDEPATISDKHSS